MLGRLRRTLGQPWRGLAGRAVGCCWLVQAPDTCSRGKSRPAGPGRRLPSPQTGPGRTHTCEGWRTPSGATVPTPALPRPSPGNSQPPPGRVEGGQGMGSRGWGLTSLLGLSGEVGMNTHPFFSPCPSTSTPLTQSDPGPGCSAPCNLRPLSSSGQCKGVCVVGRGGTRQAIREGRNGAVQPPLLVMVWPTELALSSHCPLEKARLPRLLHLALQPLHP